MKKLIASVLAFMMLAIPAFAETPRVFVADTDSGAVLIDENGVLVTGLGDYDIIDLISYGDCPADRQLFMVSQLDLTDGFFLYDEYGWDEDWDGESWDEALDDVDNWPDTDGLSEGYDMEIVDDMPIEEDWDVAEEPDDISEYLSSFYEPGFPDADYGVALMNARGELLTGFDYVSFQHDVENGVVAAYSFEGFVTMLDERGNVLVSGEYTSVVSNGNGGFVAVKPEIDPDTGDFSDTAPILLIASDGGITQTGLHTFSYETLPGYYDGLMCTPVCASDAGIDGVCEYVYLDASGADAFGVSFEYAGDFCDGLAEVLDEEYNARLINTAGSYVTDGAYNYFDMGFAGDGMPAIGNLMDGGFDLISKDDLSTIARFLPENGGTTLYAYHTGDGVIVAYSDTENMLIDAAGNVLYRGTNDTYGQLWYEFSDSQPQRMLLNTFDGENFVMCVAALDGTPVSKWYPEVLALSWTGGEGRYLVLDYELVKVEYDDVTGYEPDMDTFRYGVIDQDGNEVIGMQYDYFAFLAPDRYWAAQDTAYSLLDADGNVIASVQE